MAKDYFQDIVPQRQDQSARGAAPRAVPLSSPASAPTPRPVATHEDLDHEYDASAGGERSIRNVLPSRTRQQMNEGREVRFGSLPSAPRQSSRWWIWALAGIAVVILGGVAFAATRKTVITVTPRTHTAEFAPTDTFTAFPQTAATEGMLTYTVSSFDLEDSEVVQAQGTKHSEAKASGTITVYNNSATTPVKLVKNTRFQTSDGLIFRAPADIVIPGKTGTKPGQVQVTVIADAAGDKYNVGPQAKLTLPGLKTNAAMYTQVYGVSSSAFTGGFSGDAPDVEPGALAVAVSAMKGRLDAQVHARLAALSSATTTAFSDIASITYTDEPSTFEAAGSVRLREKVHVDVPLVDAASLAGAVARNISTDTLNGAVTLVPGVGYGVRLSTSSVAVIGSAPIEFKLTGQAQLIWNVDTQALSSALVGRDAASFQTIIKGFPSIQEAHARLAPFWSESFPKNQADIVVTVSKTPQGQ